MQVFRSLSGASWIQAQRLQSGNQSVWRGCRGQARQSALGPHTGMASHSHCDLQWIWNKLSEIPLLRCLWTLCFHISGANKSELKDFVSGLRQAIALVFSNTAGIYSHVKTYRDIRVICRQKVIKKSREGNDSMFLNMLVFQSLTKNY